MTESKNSTPATRSRFSLLLVMAIALVPLGLSYLLYYQLQGKGWTLWATTNHGELLAPTLDAGTLSVRDATGSKSELKGYWRLMLVSTSRCDQKCQAALQQLQALQILVGKDGNRIKRTLVLTGSADNEYSELGTAAMMQRFPDLEILTANALPITEGLYVIDPIGNIILRYEYSDAGKAVLSDLKKLLKISQIG